MRFRINTVDASRGSERFHLIREILLAFYPRILPRLPQKLPPFCSRVFLRFPFSTTVTGNFYIPMYFRANPRVIFRRTEAREIIRTANTISDANITSALDIVDR